MRPVLLGLACLLVAGCSGSGADVLGPRVDLIPEAVAAVEELYGSPQEYFEISAGLDAVGLIVAVDDATAAEQGSYSAEGVLTAPQPVGPADGQTFTAAQVELDADTIFEQLRDELDEPAIIDLAIQGGPDGTVLYDASVASESGGVLLVLLSASGQILAVQGQ